MSAALPREAADEELLDLVDAVVYGDVFGCAVTVEEAWRYARRPVAREELARRLREGGDLCSLVVERDGLVCLRGREALLALHAERAERARRLERRARRVARWLRHAPFVRALLLTGSAAAGAATSGADVDLLVLVSPGRLATVFCILGPLSRIVGRGVFCPNYYLSERDLALARRDAYASRELAQARGLAGSAGALWEANAWVRDVFPNAGPAEADGLPPCRSRLQRALEASLRGRLGDAVERRARRVALARLEAHHRGFGQRVPPAVRDGLESGASLRFHAGSDTGSVLAAYEERRAQVAASGVARDRAPEAHDPLPIHSSPPS